MSRAWIYFIILSIPVSYAVAASSFLKQLTTDEKKALRREMIEYDITIRDMASHISMRYRNKTEANAAYIASSPTLQHAELGKDYKKVRAKFSSAGIMSYVTNLESEAQALYTYMKTVNKSGKSVDWPRVQSSYIKILNQCTMCHQKAGVY